MTVLLKALAKFIHFFVKIIKKIIYLFLPTKTKEQIANRGTYKNSKKSKKKYVSNLRRGATIGSIFWGVLAFVMLIFFLAVLTDNKDKLEDSTVQLMLVFFFVPVLFFFNAFRKSEWRRKIYKNYEYYVAALCWFPEISLDELAQTLHSWKKKRHMGTLPYQSVQPKDISLKRNLPGKALKGYALKRAIKKAKKTLMFFMKKRLFPEFYIDLNHNRIGSLKLDKKNEETLRIMKNTPTYVEVTCVVCGKKSLITANSFVECEKCGALLAERECNASCPYFGEELPSRCAGCAFRVLS